MLDLICLVYSAISGLMGLCMGFSFVSLAEIVYYLVLGLVMAIKKMLCWNKTGNDSHPDVWSLK